jgi:hypothetical protein
VCACEKKYVCVLTTKREIVEVCATKQMLRWRRTGDKEAMRLEHVFQTGLHAPREELIAEETRPNGDSLQERRS